VSTLGKNLDAQLAALAAGGVQPGHVSPTNSPVQAVPPVFALATFAPRPVEVVVDATVALLLLYFFTTPFTEIDTSPWTPGLVDGGLADATPASGRDSAAGDLTSRMARRCLRVSTCIPTRRGVETSRDTLWDVWAANVGPDGDYRDSTVVATPASGPPVVLRQWGLHPKHALERPRSRW
jgi:hypothetical protein